MSKSPYILLFILFTLFSPAPGHPLLAQAGCALPTRLVPGVEGRVLPDSANRLRNAPSVNSPMLMNIPVGDRFQILDGPQCASGHWWWQVDYNGTVGWTAEGEDTTYWIEPMLLPELEAITTENLPRLEPLAVIGTDPVNQLAWSPDNQVILAAGSSGLWHFDLAKPDQPRLIEGYEGFFRSVAYSPDGRTFATGNTRGQTIIWNAETLQPLQTVQVSESSVEALAYPSTGDFVASGSFDGIVQLWDIAQQAEMKRWQVERGPVTSLDFSPDDHQLAVGALSYQNYIFNVQSGEMITLERSANTNSVAFSPNGEFLVTGQLHTIPVELVPLQVWNPKTGTLIADIYTSLGLIFRVDFETEDQLLISNSQQILRMDISPVFSGFSEEKQEFSDSDFELETIGFGSQHSTLSPDARTLAVLQDNTIQLIDLSSAAIRATLRVPYSLDKMDGLFTDAIRESGISVMALHPNETLLAFGKGTNIVLWNYDTGIPERKLMGHNADIMNLVFSHHGKLLAAGTYTYMHDYGPGGPSEIRIWDTTTWDLFRYFPDAWANIRTLSFNLTDQFLTPVNWRTGIGFSDAIDIQNERPAILQPGLHAREYLISITFHPTDPDIALIRVEIYPETVEETTIYRLYIWDADRQIRTELLEQKQKEAPLKASVFSPDGTLLLAVYGKEHSFNDDQWIMWKNNQRIAEGKGMRTFVFSPDNSLLAFQQEGQIVIWDVEKRQELYRLPDRDRMVSLLKFSNDSKWLIAHRDIWDIEAQEYLVQLGSPGKLNPDYTPDYVFEAQVTPDDRMLILNNGGSIELWGVPVKR